MSLFPGFDPVNANLIKDQIIRLKNEGTTIILSTHRMESVEEMCDFVALINNSKKVLDGKVFDVREKFKQNVFSVVLSDVNSENLEELTRKYQIETIGTANGLFNFELKNTENQNILLQDLLKTGTIRTFNEKIPSMNEVFINAVRS